jgi:CCR4-NOT transcription complex subunit 4
MSTQAQALLDDVRSRRTSVLSGPGTAPFPDFDRVLSVVTGGDGERGAFSFSWDSSLTRKDVDDNSLELPGLADISPSGALDSFSGLLSSLPPPTLDMAGPSGMTKQGEGYSGSFDPFADTSDAPVSSGMQMNDDPTPKHSRFDFARGRQGSAIASSPLHSASPMMASSSLHRASPISRTSSLAQSYISTDLGFGPGAHQWQHSRQDFGLRTPSATNSPIISGAHAQSALGQNSRFQPFDNQISGIVSEAQLRDLITHSQSRATSQNSFGSK